jgi:signal transduction histidine kinase
MTLVSSSTLLFVLLAEAAVLYGRLRHLIWPPQMRAVRIYGLFAVTVTLTSAAAAPLPRAALIIDEPDPPSSAPTIFSSTLRTTLSNFIPRVAVSGETLNFTRFADPRRKLILRTYIQHKYADEHFGVVIAVGASAFDLVSRWRSELWPSVPIVFAAIDEMTAAELKLDSNTTGLIMQRSLKSMMTAARILVPDLQGVTVLGGSLEKDAYRRQYLRELPILAAETKLTNLTGSPLAVQTTRAAALPDKTAILYTSLFIDDEGTRYSAGDALAEIARVANRPIVVDVENLVGLGATGGFVLNNVSYAKEVASLALRILDGDSVTANPVEISEFTQPVFDWRQLQRWGVSESRLPPGSEIRFREPTAWDLYRMQILTVMAVVVGQLALISWLIFERRRRRLAEVAARNVTSELAHMNRMATAGELSASIAHEVNQPLTGIVTLASAALRWLSRENPDVGQARQLLGQVVAAGQHASDIVTNVRAMFRRDTHEKRPVDLNKLIQSVLGLVYIDLRKYSIESRIHLDQHLPPVLGSEVQLQQVILNLVMNAIESMNSSELRVLSIKSGFTEHKAVHISIEDTGSGIDPSNLDSIFKPLFTTKERGMGMGLSICRSIIEAHDGRIWVSAGAAGGSIFQFQLPTNHPNGLTA